MKEPSQKLGILSFEAAKTMSRLLSLYKSLSDIEISRLRNDVIKSKGVAFLNSADEGFHLSLACAERLADLGRAASSVSRLAKKCSDTWLSSFNAISSEYGSRAMKKKVQKMEKLVAATSRLHAASETLTEMEASIGKVKQRRSGKRKSQLNEITNLALFYRRLEDQREKVRHLREASLWSKSFDESVRLMARILSVVYGRICDVFRQQQQQHTGPHYLGPFRPMKLRPNMVHRFCGPRSVLSLNDDVGNRRVFPNPYGIIGAAGPSTVGGSGLALRYADVILLAEKYLVDASAAGIDRYERESLYQMLPERLKALVRAKLRKNMRCAEDDSLLAKGWRDAVVEIVGWLSPMARDTVRWHAERSYEKGVEFGESSSVLLLQTLHYSDREKAEAAIAEVLVGLSCIYRFENRQLWR